jgi:hypothetical protein
MKYDTSPLSIDTVGVETAAPSSELRFVPVDQNIHQTNRTENDSGPISQATVLSRNVGFDTFIENRTETAANVGSTFKATRPNYRSWAGIGLLTVFSAIAGGSSVYLLTSGQYPVAAEQKPLTANSAVSDVQPTDAFVVKSPTENSAEELRVPRNSDVVGQPTRSSTLIGSRNDSPVVYSNSNSNAAMNANQSTATVETIPSVGGEPRSKEPEREAKVGAYVVEKPVSGRNPVARCADGTYSFSANRSSACSGRGGVSDWMTDGKPASNTSAKQATYVLGPRGGCYYLNSSNKKTYVEKKYCQ